MTKRETELRGWAILGWTLVAAGTLLALIGYLAGSWFVLAFGVWSVLVGAGNVYTSRSRRRARL